MAYTPVGVTAGTSSLDIEPAPTLDPELFDGTRLKTGVRLDLLSTIFDYLDAQFIGKEHWLRAWLAGSGVSYRWHAARDLKDLDALLGLHFIGFRAANPSFQTMGDQEIAKHLNERMREELWPITSAWRGQYEVTWYINPGSWDITRIKPYAAYDLVDDGWTVPPSPSAPRVPPDWELQVSMYHQRAQTAVERYSQSLTDLQNASNPASRADAERRFQMSVDQALGLFDTVHAGRRTAFSPTGQGYDDWGNYLWQQGKKAGWIPALKQIKDYHQAATMAHQVNTYGVELPDADTLIRRAALRYR
jgi:hypothetical protein